MKRDALQSCFYGHAPYDAEALKNHEFPSLTDLFKKHRKERRQKLLDHFSQQTLGDIICYELQKYWDECDKLEEEYFESPGWKARIEFLLTDRSTLVQP